MIQGGERGSFITLEGGEGAGKSTQAKLLAARLKERGIEVVLTREPGGTPPAEAIRALLVNGAVNRWQPMTEALLHTAARVEHLAHKITPALERGYWVVSDRFADSTRAYQGVAQGLDATVIDDLQELAYGGLAPDLTLILDLPVAAAKERIKTRPDAGSAHGAEDRYERMGDEFHSRLREAYLAIASAEPERCRVIDADGSVDTVAARIWSAINEILPVETPV